MLLLAKNDSVAHSAPHPRGLAKAQRQIVPSLVFVGWGLPSCGQASAPRLGSAFTFSVSTAMQYSTDTVHKINNNFDWNSSTCGRPRGALAASDDPSSLVGRIARKDAGFSEMWKEARR